jgi:membrane protease YdiL (CAAX protease family)
MFQVIGARYKPWLGVLITSIIFSIMHLGNDGANIFAAINIFLIAILLSLFVMKDSSIWGACGFHSAWNWTLGNVFGLSVSGTRDKTSLFDLTTKGNELLTGGQFGVEGSIVLTFLLIGSIFLLIRYLIKKGDTYSVN